MMVNFLMGFRLSRLLFIFFRSRGSCLELLLSCRSLMIVDEILLVLTKQKLQVPIFRRISGKFFKHKQSICIPLPQSSLFQRAQSTKFY